MVKYLEEFNQIAENSPNTRKNVPKRIQFVSEYVLVVKPELLRTVFNDSVVLSESPSIMDDRIIDLEDELESKDKSFIELIKKQTGIYRKPYLRS